MTRPYLKIRFGLIPSLLALCLLTSAVQAEVPLRAFSATYELQMGDMSLGTAELNLEPIEKQWRWRLQTRASGFYAMFIRKQPYSETVFDQSADELRLQSILISDNKGEDPREFASFDWEAGHFDVLRKGKQRQRKLSASVYDYQSIHLLAADMQLRQQQQRGVAFYRKGKIIESSLAYLGEETVEINDKPLTARLYEQAFKRSKTLIRYYYSATNPLLPLLIERLEEDESPSTLTLQSVDWNS